MGKVSGRKINLHQILPRRQSSKGGRVENQAMEGIKRDLRKQGAITQKISTHQEPRADSKAVEASWNAEKKYRKQTNINSEEEANGNTASQLKICWRNRAVRTIEGEMLFSCELDQEKKWASRKGTGYLEQENEMIMHRLSFCHQCVIDQFRHRLTIR